MENHQSISQKLNTQISHKDKLALLVISMFNEEKRIASIPGSNLHNYKEFVEKFFSSSVAFEFKMNSSISNLNYTICKIEN